MKVNLTKTEAENFEAALFHLSKTIDGSGWKNEWWFKTFERINKKLQKQLEK